MIEAIEQLGLHWSEPKQVNTKRGLKVLKKAAPTPEFWDIWKVNKHTLKENGYSIGKDRDGTWELCYWGELPKEEKERIEKSLAQSQAADADVDFPKPEGLEYLGYQKAGIQYCIEHDNVLIGDEMGLGKTIQALGVVNALEHIKRVLVISPASLRLNWKKEAEKWLIRDFNIGVVIQADYPIDADFLIINYDVIKKHYNKLMQQEWDLIILDEVHYLKNSQAQRTQHVFGCRANAKKKIKAVAKLPTKRWLALTGTPILNRPIELWTLIHAFDPNGLGKNIMGFGKRYCNGYQSAYGWDFTGASHLDELQLRLREKFMIRRLKEDVLTELPPKVRQIVELPPTDDILELMSEQWSRYERHEELIDQLEADIALADAADDKEEYKRKVAALKNVTKAAFEDIAYLRHQLGLAKVPELIQHLKDCLESGPIVCFVHHKDVAKAIVEAIPTSVLLTGDTKLEDRQKAVDDFQEGKDGINLFVGTIKAAGVGWTLTRASHVVIGELPFVPADVSQAEDRCHRIGQKGSVFVQHVVMQGSLDAKMAQTIISKQEVIDRALDDGQAAKLLESPATPSRNREIELVMPEEPKEKLTEEQIEAVHLGLQQLAAMCDGARYEDGCGFNKFDTNMGKGLAACVALSQKQGLLGQKLVRKYHRQLPPELLVSAGIDSDSIGKRKKKEKKNDSNS